MRRITLERTLKGWSQRQLSRDSGVDVSYISRAEKWGSRMYPSQEKKIVQALSFPDDASELYEEVNTDDLAIS